jgi:hypothetical protein
MSSKLFHAIVGVGISLGATMAACLGGVDEEPGPADAGGGEASNDTSRGEDAPAVDAGAGVDGEADAAADAPRDVILDAFCDAAWPTTKGNPHGPTCGPVEACAEAGAAPFCYPKFEPFVCDPMNQGAAAYCIEAHWECSTGSIPAERCKCWGPLEAGQACP